MISLLSVALAHSVALNTDLNQLQSDLAANAKLAPASRKQESSFNPRLWAIIESNQLRTGEEYALAADLVQFDNANYYEMARTQYELTYTAITLGDNSARKKLAERWDQLTMALGRHRTLKAVQQEGDWANEGYWVPLLSPKRIIQTLVHPEAAVSIQKDNAEIEKMFTDDQAIRQGPITPADIEKLVKGDRARLARIKEMVSKNQLATAMDYWRAAFLFQHGVTFEDYHMAHELSLCSIFLGKTDAKWIGAASYDRMLNSSGHRQRWGTQFRSSNGGPFALARPDEEGMCEFQRKTVVGLTLEESRKRKMTL